MCDGLPGDDAPQKNHDKELDRLSEAVEGLIDLFQGEGDSTVDRLESAHLKAALLMQSLDRLCCQVGRAAPYMLGQRYVR